MFSRLPFALSKNRVFDHFTMDFIQPCCVRDAIKQSTSLRIIFLKRIKTNLFYDLSISHLKQLSIKEITPLTDVSFQGNVPLSSEDYRSMGMELTFDFRFLRLVDLDLGVRFSHLLYADDSPNSFEFLLKSLSF